MPNLSKYLHSASNHVCNLFILLCLAPRHGFEPRFTAPKAAVLPLDDRGMDGENSPSQCSVSGRAAATRQAVFDARETLHHWPANQRRASAAASSALGSAVARPVSTPATENTTIIPSVVGVNSR